MDRSDERRMLVRAEEFQLGHVCENRVQGSMEFGQVVQAVLSSRRPNDAFDGFHGFRPNPQML